MSDVGSRYQKTGQETAVRGVSVRALLNWKNTRICGSVLVNPNFGLSVSNKSDSKII
jgi:hypothetical protein